MFPLYSTKIINLSSEDLISAISNLTESIGFVNKIQSSMKDGIFSYFALEDDARKAWHEVNKCRLYTENIPHIEEVLQPVLGLIGDLVCMFGSLLAWKSEMIPSTYYYITNILYDVEYQIRLVSDELASWIHHGEN